MKPIRSLSGKQRVALGWHADEGMHERHHGVIADGAIRSGKSFSMGLGFVLWAMDRFDRQVFAIAGKTIKSLRRNMVGWLCELLRERGYEVDDLKADNLLVIRRGYAVNFFYLFGGRDERSAELIQGITLAGVLLDEAQLMPESFVNQATGRCSVEGSKIWMCCNPDAPGHFLKREWIDKRAEKRLLYLHFTMDDNPSLSDAMKQRYRAMYSGVFYRRFVLGLWAQADGAVYPMFSRERHVVQDAPALRRVWLGVDYGHTNPTVFLLMGEGTDRSLYVLREYYHKGGAEGAISPAGYARALIRFLERAGIHDRGAAFDGVFVDPSAEGFIHQLREDGVPRVRKADNRVLPGIQLVSQLLESDRLRVLSDCPHTVAEFESYAWDPAATSAGRDAPLKTADHCMDALRYGVMPDAAEWRRGGRARGLRRPAFL